MKFKIFASVILSAVLTGSAFGQKKKASPAATAQQKVGDVTITIDYHQPSVKGREIYGDLVPYGKVWRTGANNATTFMIDKDVTLNGKKLAAGKYALFTIPGEKEWTIIFNKEAEQWGAYKYDKEKDALRITASQKENAATETMTFTIDKNGMIHLDWATTRVSFTIKG